MTAESGSWSNFSFGAESEFIILQASSTVIMPEAGKEATIP